jgi:lipopolysaccharide biosynthesis protein
VTFAGAPGSDLRFVAFYLPQFAPSPENDKWWGKGFTEWTMVTRGRPLLPGHVQPREPADHGYYDLRVPQVRQQQADLATAYGIGAFCYYHYWSLGHRLLGSLLDDVLATGRPDFPFCLSWTNHPWSRRWDGGNDELLFEQRYSPDDDYAHARWLARAFKDDRYLRVGGRAVLLVHWAHHVPDVRRTVAAFREVAREEGAGELYLCRVESLPAHWGRDPREDGFDASVQWQPEERSMGRRMRDAVAEGFGAEWQRALDENVVVRYDDLVDAALAFRPPPYPHHPCLIPDWDNTARRRTGNAQVLYGSTPEKYRYWLEQTVARTRGHDPRLVFVNAWNEWSEAAYLEPDAHSGHRYLQAHLGLTD